LWKEIPINKSELLTWLQEEHRQWEALLARIGPYRMEQSGVNGPWSFKDLIAHLVPDGWRCAASLEAIRRGQPEPPPPWPEHLQTDDEINAWVYATSHARPLREVLDESQRMFQRLFAAVKELPEEVTIDTITQGERVVYLVGLGEQHIQPGYIFDHFHDDHEQDVRAWLSRMEEG
jgi:hypothetical protein